MARCLRTRMLDAVLVTVAVACLSAPLLPVSFAAEEAIMENGVTVDQRVQQSGLISMPLNGDFDAANSGKELGKVDWEVYSSSGRGYKLVVSSDGVPAMRDAAGNEVVSDHGGKTVPWSVAAGDRRFGFSASGTNALDNYSDGDQWRGFAGRRSVEVARRRSGPVPVTRTTVRLGSEMRAPLPASSKPKVWVVATAVLNL